MLTQERLKEVIHYDEITGIFTWLVTLTPNAKAGDVAGGINNHGYHRIQIDGERVLGHRLAWLYVTGELPPFKLDHRDGNTANNAISNLRLATNSQNLANSKLSKANTSGLKGASWHKRSKQWSSCIKYRNKQIWLGYHKTKELAHEAYCKAARRLFGTFARVA